jgi:hypothetical protein
MLVMPDRAPLVTALILERPMCEACIGEKSGLSPAAFDATLSAIRVALKIHDLIGRCRACGETDRVLSLERPIS